MKNFTAANFTLKAKRLRWLIPVIVLALIPSSVYVFMMYSSLPYVLYGFLPGALAAHFFGTDSFIQIILISTGLYFFVLLIIALLARRFFWKHRQTLGKIAFVGVACAFVIYVKLYIIGVPYSRVYSPDGTRYVQFLEIPMLISNPGGGSGWSGYARLKTWWGLPLNQAKFGVFNHLDRRVQWTTTTVSVRGLLEWDYNGNGYTRSYEDLTGQTE